VTYSQQKFLDDWQEYWGQLDAKWLPTFLNHQSLEVILGFDRKLVLIAITKSRKLIGIAKYLEVKSRDRASNEAQTAPIIQRSDRDIQAAIRAGYLNSKYDPKIPDNDWWREQE
jgi:hypothetical protein